MVVQYHLLREKVWCIVPGLDACKFRHVFCPLQKNDAMGVVQEFGDKPRFAGMWIKWYKRRAVDNTPRGYELYVAFEAHKD